MSTNPIKGEFALELEGGRKLVLVSDFNAQVAAEEAYGKPYKRVLEDARQERLGAIRALFYGLLIRHQPDLSLDDVGDLIHESGAEIMDAANRAMGAAAPKTEDRQEGNPPRRRRGKNSGGNGAKSG